VYIKCFKLDPDLLPVSQVDKGAIKFILDGANAMCPGFTSKGGVVPKVKADTVVVRIQLKKSILAEGKENAMAVGVTVMSEHEM
jgi:PUA domain protein